MVHVILAVAPDGKYQVTSGTSIAAAHASGVAALLLASKSNLTPAQVRASLIRAANRIPGSIQVANSLQALRSAR